MTIRNRAPARAILVVVLCGILMFLFAGCAGPTRGPAGQEPLAAKPEPRVTIPEPKTSSKLLRSIYREPIYGGPQVYPAATTLEQINERLEAMLVPADSFFGAYSRIQLQGHGIDTLGTVNRLALSVDYGLDGRALTAHAYFKPSGKGEERCAALVIPGSGNNQSTAILKRDPDNYQHDITFAVDRLCDMYIYVKPNEDFLAIHDMRAKLRNEYLIGHLINSGGSYSTLYLNHTLAIVKYLKDSYDKVIVLGLSQGGKAALLNALQSSPDGAVVSSGFSILEEHIFGAGLGQIMVPGLNDHYGVARTYDLIRDSSTRYIFTFGKKERGVYGIEAREYCTCEYFNDLTNVECNIHNSGHKFPVPRIRQFVLSVIAGESGGGATGVE